MFLTNGDSLTLNPAVGATEKGHSNIKTSFSNFVNPVDEQSSKQLADRWGGHYDNINRSQIGVLLRYEFDNNIEVLDYEIFGRSGHEGRANNIGIALYDGNGNMIGTPTIGRGNKILNVKNVRALELVIQKQPQQYNQFNYFILNLRK